MNQNLCILIVMFLLLTEASFALDFYYQNCSVSVSCGRQDISYPFYIQGKQASFCGYPGFQLSCHGDGEDAYPLLQLSGNNYTIHNIDYQNKSLLVSNSLLSGYLSSTACNDNISSLHNITFPNDQYKLASNQADFFLLYNCNSSVVESFPKYKVGCFDQGTNKTRSNTSVLALPRDEYPKFGSRKCGGEVVVAHAGRGGENGELGLIQEVLRRGFELNWLAGDCNRCQDSGGRCGFNYTTYHFRCLCPRRTHSVRCRDDEGDKLGLKLGLGIGCPVLIAVCLFLLWHYKQKRAASNFLSRNISSQPHTNSDIEGGVTYFGVPVFTYTELEEATNHFDGEKELGDGGFGTVYYGKLKDGREVAVKRLYEHNYKRVEQFMNEIEILTRLRHQNLVSLYGCTSHRSRELLLVYEYIPNGTVADHLHGERADTGALAWPIRMSIAIETASALSYLHASEIVHRDVKTTNILLDNNFCVKVADFGLSRLFPMDVTHVSTAPQGTPGYVDPEYHQCYQLTSKSDVYSFGVVLIELISSLPAVDISRHRHEINLSNLAVSKIQKGLFNELVDQCLGFESDDEVRRMVIAVAELAFQCLQQDNDMRPTMCEVLEALKMIESGNDLPDNLKPAFDNAGMKTNILPPPSPDCDEIGLLKNKRLLSSPISVTQKWPSTRSTTPNASA
ncbi:PREDICTED: LEAF RUST 10 DISEASE-RESISTANCE LOCUS RECEPTOR-LIKE PROTEIN KINASE-like 1.2 isoform X2 [Prunus mume]|uniref:non-specific serine/threonine protein kinase n=1 Tax=Prunus mume TaxID=102107 RepID=A0ABM1LXA8_PRUMU|nr:PREDICTED: LEAF RUST 10 DISEASE-RESISTANCE LOCUS RECEPTOR-LIKE PROTEIN KINASE-like 1.2 isoform X2 [Prunus mume]